MFRLILQGHFELQVMTGRGLDHISFQLEAERMVALILAQSVENLITRVFLECHSWSFFLKIRTTVLLTS